MPPTRGTIVVLTAGYTGYEKAVVDAVGAVADAAGFGTLCATGRELEPDAAARSGPAVCNGIYRLVERMDVAGLICESGVLGHRAGADAIARFLARFPLPLVSLGVDVPNVPSVVADDELGMRRLMEHLLADDRRRRFAFVRGPHGDVYSGQRERVFRELLVRHGRELDEALLVSGNYDVFDAYNAVAELLGLHPDIDAIVAANDTMALSAARAATAAGASIPHDIVVTGFDDMPDATRFSPALTTVRQPLVEIAELGVAKLIELLEQTGTSHRPATPSRPRLSRVSSELVVRGSTMSTSESDDRQIDSERLYRLLSGAMVGLRAPQGADLRQLANALERTITHGSSELTDHLARVVGQMSSRDARWWSNLCHQTETICRRLLYASDLEAHLPQIGAALARVRDRIWAAETERELRARRFERMRSTMQLQIGSCTGIAEILRAVGYWTEAFGPRRLFLVRYDEPGGEPCSRGRLLWALREGVVEAAPNALLETRDILPRDFADELERGVLIANPIYAGSEHFGYLLIDPHGLDLTQIDDAAQSIGNAMRSHYLFDALERQAARLRDANAELSALANRDALTRLPNRLCLEEYLRELCELGGCERPEERFALCFLDLDGFKLINDTLGHEAGDELLRTAAVRLERVVGEAVGERGFVARLGGDEFTVIVRSDALESELERVVPSLLATLSDPYTLAEQTVNVSVSIGGAVFPDHGEDAGTLLRRADSAMYEAKARGKDGFVLYRPEACSSDSRLGLAQDLRAALEDGGLRMHFQPRVDLITGETCAVEALMRWMVDTPEGEEPRVGPDVFIPIAEESGLITRLGDLALEQSCRQASLWARAGTPLRVSVNVSHVQLQQESFLERMTDALGRHRLDPDLLELEIAESTVMEDVETNIGKLGRLRELGVRVVIDDFGAGYSSLSCLGRLPACTLKIDRSFIGRIGSSPHESPHEKFPDRSRANAVLVVRTIIGLGKSLGFTLVAEGIETAEQLDVLRTIGCDEGQGFLLGRPAPAHEIDRRLDDTLGYRLSA